MLKDLTGWHALVILAVVLLIFGATKLPALAKSVGQSVRILKKEVGESDGTASGDSAGPGAVSRATPATSSVAMAAPTVSVPPTTDPADVLAVQEHSVLEGSWSERSPS